MEYDSEEMGGLPVSDTTETLILMHRDAHFSGSFDLMIEYYQQEGKGASLEISLEKIFELAKMEEKSGENLAAVLLGGPEAEKVARAKVAYKKLRDLYEEENLPSDIPLLIADLILSEEEEPKDEIAKIVAKGNSIVAPLIEVLRSTDLADPLFPGYGTAPELAALCLGKIGDKRALFALFEEIGSGDFFADEVIFDGLRDIGEPAKEFLLNIIKSRPLREDNERAAMALVGFKEDREVASTCLDLLKDPEIRKNLSLAGYLVLACESLQDPLKREEFKQLAQEPTTSKELKMDIQAITNEWI